MFAKSVSVQAVLVSDLSMVRVGFPARRASYSKCRQEREYKRCDLWGRLCRIFVQFNTNQSRHYAIAWKMIRLTLANAGF